MARETTGRHDCGALYGLTQPTAPDLLQPRCPLAPAPSGLTSGLRSWLTTGLGALGLGLALSLSAGTAHAESTDGADSGAAKSSATAGSDSSSDKPRSNRPTADATKTAAESGDKASDKPTDDKASDKPADDTEPDPPAVDETAPPVEPETDAEPEDTATDPVGETPTEQEPPASGDTEPADDESPDEAESTSDSSSSGDEDQIADSAQPATVVKPVATTGKTKESTEIPTEEWVEPTTSVQTVAAASAQTPAAEAVTAAALPGAAALVNGRVVVGTIIVDILNGFGLPVPGQWAAALPIRVPSQVEVFWFQARRGIYGSGPNPGGPGEPGNPGELPLLWETNFDSVEEAERYWMYHTGRWGASAGDKQYYTDGQNSYIDADGNLVLEARRETPPDGAGAPYNYTSSRMVTYGKQSISVGNRVVARIQMPTDKGTVPAFWTLGLKPGDEFDFPSQGEIDIAEAAGHGTDISSRTWVGALHGGASWNEDLEIKTQGIGHVLDEDMANNFHEFGMDWHSDRIVWHIDGQEVARITQQEWEAIGGDWTPFSGAYAHYLVLNIAVGNNWTGDPPADEPFHSEMKVDWVKVYQLDSDTVAV